MGCELLPFSFRLSTVLSLCLLLLPNSPASLNIRKSDVLTVFDGGDLTARILGQYLGPHPRFSIYSSGPAVTLQFQSDPGDPLFGLSQGFLVRYKGMRTGYDMFGLNLGAGRESLM